METLGRIMLVSATLDTSYWPWAVEEVVEINRAQALKPSAQITPCRDRVVADMITSGIEGWALRGIGGRLVKPTPWPGEAWALPEHGSAQGQRSRVGPEEIRSPQENMSRWAVVTVRHTSRDIMGLAARSRVDTFHLP